MAGGPVAAINQGPILLVHRVSVQVRRGLSPETETELARLQPHKIIILGGTGVVSPTIEALATYLS